MAADADTEADAENASAEHIPRYEPAAEEALAEVTPRVTCAGLHLEESLGQLT